MELTLELNFLWFCLGLATTIVVYIMTSMYITERSERVQWIWGTMWVIFLSASIRVMYVSLAASGEIPGIHAALVAIPMVWLMAHVSGCLAIICTS